MNKNSFKEDKMKELYNYLSKFDYGILINNRVETKNIDFKKYKTISISDMDKYRVGVCWDFVNYEYNWLKDHDYKCKAYFMCIDDNNMCPSHTFILVDLNNKIYWIEPSWDKYMGIHEYKNEKEALHDIINKHNIHYNKNNYKIYYRTYTPNNKLVGITAIKYMNYMLKNIKEYTDIIDIKESTENNNISDNNEPDVITESYVISKNDLYHNFEKFENGDSNVLLITGLSGSGKSTLAKQIGSKYNATVIELDSLDFYCNESMRKNGLLDDEPWLVQFLNSHKDIKLSLEDNPSSKEMIASYRIYIPWVINWCKKQNKKYVIEGLQIYEIANENDIKSFLSNPMIIKGTSAVTSALQGAKRNSEESGTSRFKEFIGLFKWAIKDQSGLKALKKAAENYINESTENLFIEDSKYDYAKRMHGNEYVKALRKVEILKTQLKNGKITQEEFDKEYNKVSIVINDDDECSIIPKKGIPNIELNRPNKNKPDDSIKKIKNYDKDGAGAYGKTSDNMKEKINHYNKILRYTENYNEYKDAFKNLSHLLGKPNACTIKIYRTQGNASDLQYTCFSNKIKANCNKNTKLYHTSTQKGLTRLNGKFRGEECFYFSSKRVYFHKNKPGSRFTSATNNYIDPGTYVYEYIGDPSNAYIDPEIGGTAVFIETDTSIPVKDVTNEFRNNTINESSNLIDNYITQFGGDLMFESLSDDIMGDYLYESLHIEENLFNIILEANVDTHIMVEELYPKISDILSTPVGDRKFKHLIGAYMDRNSVKLHTAGPTYLVPFADKDKAEFLSLFKLDVKFIKNLIKKVVSKIGSGSQFKLLTNNPIFWVFYCCIRYYTLKKDEKGLNSALAIYALSNYPSVFTMSFPHPPNPSVMQYTMDNLSEKFIMKQAGHVFGGLFLSIKHSYDFLKPYMTDASDKEIIRFIQRIRNDQKSMMKNICDKYMKDHAAGNRVKLNIDSFDAVQVDVDAENNTTIVQTVADNIVNQLTTNGLDLRRVNQCKDIAQIGLADCRFYLSKILTNKYVSDISKFIYSVLFLYLYDDKKTKLDINSSYFLKWSSELFRKTNSNNANIRNIKDTLDKWAEETGVHAKFKREASRVNYKKAIFWYFILSIQYYNK